MNLLIVFIYDSKCVPGTRFFSEITFFAEWYVSEQFRSGKFTDMHLTCFAFIGLKLASYLLDARFF